MCMVDQVMVIGLRLSRMLFTFLQAVWKGVEADWARFFTPHTIHESERNHSIGEWIPNDMPNYSVTTYRNKNTHT